ncbi:hypothetical protein JCM11641_004750 [Rhodosporidiobolus odoratus]
MTDTTSLPPPTPFYTALVAGALAGTSVDTLFFPIDTLKTRLQSSQGFVQAGGFKGVYRGLGSAVVGSAPGASFFFTTYETLKGFLPRAVPQLREEGMRPVVHMLSASGGEVAACLIRVPTEVVKQRSQTSSAGTGSLAVFRAVLARDGSAGFYRGFGTTVAREIPFSLLQFPLYEHLKLVLATYHNLPSALSPTNPSSADLPAIQAAGCGSLAGGVAAGLTTPLDVCKTRIMLSNSSSSSSAPSASSSSSSSSASPTFSPSPSPSSPPSPSPSTTATSKPSPPLPQHRHYPNSLPLTLRLILREEGPRALFKGWVPRVLWISGGGAVFLGVYEAGKKGLAGNGAGAVTTDGVARD